MADFNTLIDAIQREDLETVKILFRKEFINLISSEGYTALHVACMSNNKGDIVKYLVREGCNMEDEARGVYGGGWRCIHISAGWAKVEVLKTLIEGGCDIDSLSKNGETASSVALRVGKNKECEAIIKRAKEAKIYYIEQLKNKSLSTIMDPQTGKTLLDKLLINRDQKIFEAIKSKPVDDDEIDEWRNLDVRMVDAQSYRLLHECMFARCLYQRYEDGILDLCTADLVNKDSIFMDQTALETAVNCGVTEYSVRNILWKLVKIDESWTRAENIAKHKNKRRFISLISRRRKYLNDKMNTFSRLHVAVIENEPEVITFMMNNQIINVDEGHKKCGTAFSLSYYIGNMDCVQSFQSNNVNVNTVDKFKQSPLHMAIYNRIENYSDYLVDNIINIEDTDFMNFTLLERSVMNDCKYICERLVDKGARCDKYVTIDHKYFEMDPDLNILLYNTPHLPLTTSETIYTLCFKVNKTVYPGLLYNMDVRTVDLTDGDGKTLLQLSAMSLNSKICSKLIQHSANVNLKNEFKRTLLFEVLIQHCNPKVNKIHKNIIETVNVLIDGGASVNVEDCDGRNIFEVATNYDNEELLLALIHKREPIINIKKSEWSVWINKNFFKFIKEVIPLIDESLLREWITEDDIKCCLQLEDVTVLKIMYNKAKTELQINIVETILYKAATVGNKELFKEMIENDLPSIDVNNEEESLLNCLIRENLSEYIELVILSKNGEMLLEKEGIGKKLPLHVCIECDYWDVIDQLIKHTKSVDSEDNDGNTPLSLLLTKMSETEDEILINKSLKSVKGLIRNSANIYKVNKLNKAVIEYCTESHLKLRIERFIQKSEDVKVSSKETKQEQQSGAVSDLATSKEIKQCGAASIWATSKEIKQCGAASIWTCPICENETRNCVLNCGHMFCMSCVEKKEYCFVCRIPITDIRKVYM